MQAPQPEPSRSDTPTVTDAPHKSNKQHTRQHSKKTQIALILPYSVGLRSARATHTATHRKTDQEQSEP